MPGEIGAETDIVAHIFAFLANAAALPPISKTRTPQGGSGMTPFYGCVMGNPRVCGTAQHCVWSSDKIKKYRALPSLIAMVLLLTSSPAESWKLKLDTSWPGQYDTETGAPPYIGFPLPTCSQSAEPTIAVSDVTVNAGASKHYKWARTGISAILREAANQISNVN
jgi:hypothetical protein